MFFLSVNDALTSYYYIIVNLKISDEMIEAFLIILQYSPSSPQYTPSSPAGDASPAVSCLHYLPSEKKKTQVIRKGYYNYNNRLKKSFINSHT